MNGFALALLAHPLLGTWAGKSMVGLRVRGRRTGRWFTFPVQYAEDTDGLIVMPGNAESKTWWRNLESRAAVGVLTGAAWTDGSAWVLCPGDRSYGEARVAYESRWPRVSLPVDQPLVRIVLDESRRNR
jgi:hypothetical protein